MGPKKATDTPVTPAATRSVGAAVARLTSENQRLQAQVNDLMNELNNAEAYIAEEAEDEVQPSEVEAGLRAQLAAAEADADASRSDLVLVESDLYAGPR